ncbi:NAD-P-binding protein [Leucosporidium creatinivorum]|uniref:NAD-P-binding protein n=1 Tax=Leucosporidium creatinivorum TaxID=106004 RepID=A0A1Y2G7L5_9BASI|nr:NAD-P-binding protein [Leucosporidium creatinivorum]
MLVLVTAISGYIGSATALACLRAGHRVRGTLRSEAKATAFRESWKEWEGQLEFAIVPDMQVKGAYDEACVGVDWIAHIASPFVYGYTDNERDMLQPAIRGTLEILESAQRAGSVARIVITSSFAALQDYAKGVRPGYTYSIADWCPLTYEDGKNATDQLMVYVASKKLAEEAAWRFMETEKPSFTLSTICPAFVLGSTPQPLHSLNELSVSAAWIRSLIDVQELPPTPLPAMNDVSDIALCHLRALERPVAAGKRYLTIAHEFSSSQVAHLLHQLFPEQSHRFPPTKNEPPAPHFWWDTKSTEVDLGIEWKSLEQTIKEAGQQIFELEKREAAARS